ncbi:EamA family transporter [Salinilacihabitans rarus]|uniref:EamA family transporter n=1 Tax=Salinilacihabitans rarus TaxID=2961596 RepID=UPI0020C86F00|nr:DMT family transporter [Salinilacihabitans rarus]
MDPGLGYSVLAAVVWGVYLFGLKQYFEGYPATTLSVCINAFAIAFYLPVTLRALSDGAAASLSDAGATHVGVVALTVCATAAAFVLFLYAIADGDVSYVAPINKVVPAFVLPIEVLVLGQLLAPLQVVGVLVATLAIYVANYRAGGLLDPFRRAARSRPAQLALLSAALFAVSDVGKRVALQELAIPTALWVPLLLAGVLVVLLPSAVRERPDDLRGDLPKFAAAGAVVALGEHTTTVAFSLVPASVASPIINTQAIVAVLLGGVLLGEEHFRVRIVAAVLAVAGVTLIAL